MIEGEAPVHAWSLLAEPVDKLSPETMDLHRAIISLIEELEAVDWYNQRVDACADAALKAILAHNRDEEIEHAAMTLEWIRRRNASRAWKPVPTISSASPLIRPSCSRGYARCFASRSFTIRCNCRRRS